MESKEDRLEQLIIRAFQYFYRRFHSKPNYKFEPKPAQISSIHNFIEDISKTISVYSIGEHYIFDYFCYQFENWLELDDFDINKRKTDIPVQLNWIIGGKALARWRDRSVESTYAARKKMVGLGYSVSQLDHPVEIDWSGTTIYEEIQKEQHFGDENTLAYCIDRTSLINLKSDFCRKCNFQKECKEILRENNRKLYGFRGFEKNEK